MVVYSGLTDGLSNKILISFLVIVVEVKVGLPTKAADKKVTVPVVTSLAAA